MKTWNFIYGWPRTNRSRFEHGTLRLGRWIKISSGRTVIAALVTGFFSSGFAAENEQIEAAPDLEFLEFLGQFETDAGEWIDPESLLTEGFTELLDVTSDDETNEESIDSDNAASNTQ